MRSNPSWGAYLFLPDFLMRVDGRLEDVDGLAQIDDYWKPFLSYSRRNPVEK
jgi:hypothetical protein